MTSPRGGLREEADPGEEVGVAATGLSVAATARRRPKTPEGDRAEKGLTGKVGPKAPAWWAGREGWPRKGAQAVSRPRREAPRAGPVEGARKARGVG